MRSSSKQWQFCKRCHKIYMKKQENRPTDWMNPKSDVPVVLVISVYFTRFFYNVIMMSWPTFGSESCAVWLQKMPTSEWGSLWESSSFVPWSVPNGFRDVSGVVPEWPWISGFMRKSSSRPSAPSMRFSVLLNSCDNLLWLYPQFHQKLEWCSPLETWERLSFVPSCA